MPAVNRLLKAVFFLSSSTLTGSFAALGVPSQLVTVLAERNIDSPFPIQTATLPDTLAGRDVLGRGRTGSGKTLAFALPLAVRLGCVGSRTSRAKQPRGLVLAPTRELASQILDTIAPLAAAVGLSATTIFGGVSQHRQVQALQRGVDIVVATPGRLEDLMRQGHVRLDAVEITVLDEADHMADLGFLPGVTRILTATPERAQRMLFSATLDRGVDKIVKQFLHNPLVHSVDSAESPVAAMSHHVFLVRDASAKSAMVRTLAGGSSRRLLFTRTKHQARKLARQLTQDGIPAVEMHGNLSQNARERGLHAFSSGEVQVMVATDIAARGIHVDDVDLVVHVDPPVEHKAYLHRSGRTARAGNDGDVVTLVLPEQRSDFRAIAKAAKIRVEPTEVQASDARVLSLVGGVAAPIDPSQAPSAAARQGSSAATSRGNGGRGRSDRASSGRNPESVSGRGVRGGSSGRGARSESGAGRESRPANDSGRNSRPVNGSGQRGNASSTSGGNRGVASFSAASRTRGRSTGSRRPGSVNRLSA